MYSTYFFQGKKDASLDQYVRIAHDILFNPEGTIERVKQAYEEHLKADGDDGSQASLAGERALVSSSGNHSRRTGMPSSYRQLISTTKRHKKLSASCSMPGRLYRSSTSASSGTSPAGQRSNRCCNSPSSTRGGRLPTAPARRMSE